MRSSKSHLDYWKAVLRKQKIPPDEWEGPQGKAHNWEVYVQHRGRREWFNLKTPNKESAASYAREIYRSLIGAGWQPTLLRFKPEVVRKVTSPTVRELLDEVEKFGGLKPQTYRTYASKLRGLIASILGIEGDASKFDFHKGGNRQWRAQIDNTRVSKLSLPTIQAWKKKVLAVAGDSPLAQQHARRTINSILRNAKSLFAPSLLKHLTFQLETPVPLEGVSFEKVAKPRYRSKIDAVSLLASARSELPESDPETYKIFLLALCVGLRRREIDGLLWTQIDFQRRIIRVETNNYTELKSAESEDEIDLSPELTDELKRFQEKSFSAFVIGAPRPPKKSDRYSTYRCDVEFKRLIAWLNGKGIAEDKPLHTLRKEFGSVIAAKHGIFAASSALRHSGIAVTRDHYVDKKEPIYFPASGAAS